MVRDVIIASGLVAVTWLATFFLAALVEYAPHASLWFPPAAISYAALLVFGWRALPGLFVACLAGTVAVSVGYALDREISRTLLIGAGFAMVHCVAYGLVAIAVRRSLGIATPTLLRTVTVFLLAGLVGAAVAAFAGAWVIHWGGLSPEPDARAIVVPWLIGDYAGLLALGPLAVDLFQRAGRRLDLLPPGSGFGFLVLPSPPARRRAFSGKLALLLAVTALVLLAIWRLPGDPAVAFAIFAAAIVQLWIVHTEGARAAVRSLAAFSIACAIGAGAFDLIDAALTLQFAVIVVAASTCFGLAVPVLYAENARLRELLIHDPLTGAYSRAFFEELAAEHLAAALTQGRPAALVLLDVDRLKPVNDRFGHAAGDRLLQAIVAACRSTLAPGELIGRVGGDEFALLLPAADAAIADAKVERIRRAFAGIAGRRDDEPPPGASVGVAVLGRDGDDYASLVARADAAMYADKRAARDRGADRQAP